jgi:hypothetical protein
LRRLPFIEFILQSLEAFSVVCLLGAEVLYALVGLGLLFRHEFLLRELVVVFYGARE